MSRYHVNANSLLYGDFYDSGDAHRYAKSLSNRLPGITVAVSRDDDQLFIHRNDLQLEVRYRGGRRVA
jgi:hypothetical protein